MKKGRTVKQAVELFESFRERKPTRIGRVTLKVPTVVAAMGYVEGIDYRTTHGSKTELYHHDFAPGSRPLLAVSADGRQILLLGGRYKWTERGIVDRDHNDREIENEGHGKVIKPRKGNPARTVIDGAALAKMLSAELKAVKAGKIPVRTPAQDALMAQYAAALRQVSQATYAAGKAAARKGNPGLKQKEVFAQIRALGLTVKRDEVGEFRVTFKGVPADRAEAMAHYTDDLGDLLSTAQHMAKRGVTGLPDSLTWEADE